MNTAKKFDKQTTNIQVRVSENEKNMIINQAKENGFDSMSGYVKYLIRMDRKTKNIREK